MLAGKTDTLIQSNTRGYSETEERAAEISILTARLAVAERKLAAVKHLVGAARRYGSLKLVGAYEVAPGEISYPTVADRERLLPLLLGTLEKEAEDLVTQEACLGRAQ